MYKRIYKYIVLSLIATVSACTDLSENLYDRITTQNFYQTKEDIIRACLVSYDHCYWSIQCGEGAIQRLQESTADQIITYNRQGHWNLNELYRLGQHQWSPEDFHVRTAYIEKFKGVTYCNAALNDLEKINPADFGMPVEQFNGLMIGLKTLRAWCYLSLLDMYRNIPLAYSLSEMTDTQVTPLETFQYIEKELKDAIPLLPKKLSTGGNGIYQMEWTQGAAAALLVRLYLNAEKYIGEPRYRECAEYCQKIINGEYGTYAIADRWDAPFDWDNDKCDEIIYAFSGTYSGSHWHYSNRYNLWVAPFRAHDYFGFTDWGWLNPCWALTPGLDLNGEEYAFQLGKPVRKFMEYPEDYRLLKYRNLGDSKREGMFLYGYLDYEKNGEKLRIKDDGERWEIYLRDQVGLFEGRAPGQKPSDEWNGKTNPMTSDWNHADQNSGWCVIKYPLYRSDDAGKIESDFAEIRLAEIYYSLAECKLREGNVDEAGRLLNTVRKRNYPEDSWSKNLYAPEGSAVLNMDEMLDEWGREFIFELRRRTDLIRFNKFCQGEWWDKQADSSTHLEIFPIPANVLRANPGLKQNPGYPDIER